MSTAALERPSPTGITTRHAVSARLQSLRPVEPPCGQEPFDDLAARVPVATAGMQRRDHARPSSHARLRCTGIRDRLADRRGARGARPRSAANVIEGWNAYRDHGPRLVGDGGCDVRLGRGGVAGQGTGGAARVAPAHGPRARRLRGRPVRGRTHPCDRAARPSADDLGPRRGDRRRAAVPARSALRARAVRRDRAPCVRADPRRAPRPAPPGGRQNRGPVAGGRAPGCERDHRLRLRARR